MNELEKKCIVAERTPYRIELFQENAITLFRLYIQKIFNKDYSEDYIRWKYFTNPLGLNTSLLLFKDEQLIGFRGGIPMKYHIDGRNVLAAIEEDNSLLSEHRSMTLYLWFSMIFANYLQKNDILFTIGVPNENAIEIIKLDPASSKVADRPLHIRYHNTINSVRKKITISPLAHSAAFLINNILNVRYFRLTKIPDDVEVKILHFCDNRFDSFWELIKNEYGIGGVRDASFLNWRYLNAPSFDAEIICLINKTTRDIGGYAIIGKTADHEKKIGNIYEFVTPRNIPQDHVKALLNTAIDFLTKKDIDVVYTWIVKDMDNYDVFKKYGFFQRGKDWDGAYVRMTNASDKTLDFKYLKNVKNWIISRGDLHFH